MATTKTIIAEEPGRIVAIEDCRRCPARGRCLLFQLRDSAGTAPPAPVQRPHRARTVIFSEGQPCEGVAVLAAGSVMIRRRDPVGDLLFVERLTAGRLLDPRALLAGSWHLATAVAEGKVEICTAPREDVCERLAGHVKVVLAVLEEAERERRHIEQALRIRCVRPMQARIGLLLQIFAQSVGERGEGGTWRVALPVHRRDLAELVGARPETVSRIIHTMEAQGLAHFRGRHVEIPRLELLSQA